MAWTARTEDETQEFFDPPEELDRKVSQLVEWVRSSKHAIVFTVSEPTVMVSSFLVRCPNPRTDRSWSDLSSCAWVWL